jgi:Pvc16 N-terminal domain
MADFRSIAAAGRSVERFLNRCFDEEEPVPGRSTQAVLVRTSDFEPGNAHTAIVEPALSIFVYRIDFNRTLRAAWSAVGSQEGRAHLPLDIYFLITPWAENADFELRILGRAMAGLDATPILSGPLLDPLGGWQPGEAIQVCLADLTTEDLMRTFDSLPVDYQLSVLYVARVVTVSERTATPDPAVTTLATGARPGVAPS